MANVPKIEIIAHRGAWGKVPQNSVAAVREAVRLRTDWIEGDARLLADGTVVMHHDPVRAGRRIQNLTLAQLRALPGGGQVPTLEEWVKAAGEEGRLLVEFKTAEVVRPAMRILAGVPASRLCVQSFWDRHLVQAQLERPDVAVSWLEAVPVRAWRRNEGPEVVGLFWLYALLGGCSRAHRQGKAVRIWTVNWRWLARVVVKMPGVSGIITDRPAQMQQWIAQNPD